MLRASASSQMAVALEAAAEVEEKSYSIKSTASFYLFLDFSQAPAMFLEEGD
jgi:hypothetical protein